MVKFANPLLLQVIPLDHEGRSVGNHSYVKTGLMGYINSAGMVFVSGTVAGLIGLAGRKHNSEDIRATVLAVEPPTFVHRLRIAIFSVSFVIVYCTVNPPIPPLSGLAKNGGIGKQR